MFSGIKRNAPPQSSPSTEPAAKRQQTTHSVLKHHLGNLAADIQRGSGGRANDSIALANLSRAQSVDAIPAFSTLPLEIIRNVVSFFDPYSQNNSALVNKELKGLVREQQHLLTLHGQDLSRALTEFPNATSIKFTQAPTVHDIERILNDQTAEQLQYLDFSGCIQLTDEAITALLEKCPNFTFLSMEGCVQVSDAAIAVLAGRCPNLAYLDLTCCDQLTDAAIAVLAGGCPNLSNLELACCGQLTNAAIAALANACPDLTYLDLTGCNELTDVAIAVLANKCPNLANLSLACCDELTNVTIRLLAARFPNLSSLDLRWCPYITHVAVTALREQYPNLDICIE